MHFYITYSAIKTKLVRIGNSQGIRIPKPIIEEIGLTEEIEMILKDNQIILRSAKQTRKGWDNAFERIAEKQDNQLIDKEEVEAPSQWDETEWTW